MRKLTPHFLSSLITLGSQTVFSEPQLESILVTAPAPSAMTNSFSTTIDNSLSEALAIENMDELSLLMPGVRMQAQGITSIDYVIRGVASSHVRATNPSRVGMFNNGVDVSFATMANLALYDIEQVQAYNGPQSTVLSRSVQAGAVDIISRRAQTESSANTTLKVGEDSLRHISGHANGQLFNSGIYGRLAYLKETDDGYVNNLLGSDLLDTDTEALRGSLLWQGNDTRLDVIIDYQQDNTSGTAFKSFNPALDNSGFHEASNDPSVFIDREIWSATTILEHSINSRWSVSNLLSYRNGDSYERFDADGSAISILLFDLDNQAEQVSESIRFHFNDNDRFVANTGLDINWRDSSNAVTAQINEAFLLAAPLNTNVIEQQELGNESLEIDWVTDGTWRLDDVFSLVAGLRFSYLDQTSRIITPTYTSAAGNPTGKILFSPENSQFKQEGDSNEASWHLALQQKLSPNSSRYIRYARGVRPEILDFDEDSSARQYNAETIDSFELGYKNLSPTGQYAFETALYYQDFDNFLTDVPDALNQKDDQGQASSYGVELNSSYRFNSDISALLNLTYNHARIDDKANLAFADNQFRLSPDWSGTLSLHKQQQMQDYGTAEFSVSTSFQSNMYFDDDNKFRQGGYALTKLHSRFTSHSEKWSVGLTVFNLFDKEYVLDAGNTGELFGLPTYVPGKPRTISASVTFNY
jgi:outer membrane receptor protein involved in Fe transport